MKAALLQSSDPVPYTARLVAAKQAIERLNPAPLFRDLYADALAGDEVDALLSR